MVLDFLCVCSLLHNITLAVLIIGGITLYVFFGGYIALLREGAIRSKKLPVYQQARLDTAKAQLITDIRANCGARISGLKLYLIPGSDELNASAYGCGCISVTQGTLRVADPITLSGVLAHEISHILHFDAEFKRALLSSVMLVVAGLSIMSFATVAIIFLLFLLLCWFRSCMGVMAFRGITKVVRASFQLLQRGVVAIYRALFGMLSRHSEYRSDRFSCQLGYGMQLAHFLTLSEPSDSHQSTLTEAIYRTHPPSQKRIARLEAYRHS